MSDETFTQEQVNEAIQNAKKEWQEQELNPVVAERDDLLQYKPKNLTDEEKVIQQQQEDLFNEKVAFQLEKSGLEKFAPIIKVNDEDELKEVVKTLNQITNEIKLATGYIPKDNAADDEYSKFQKDGNTQGMIATKLGKLFK